MIYDTRSGNTDRPLDHVEFGPATGADLDRRMLGEVNGRRVLELGCGAGHTAVGLALRGARVTAVDADVTQINAARGLAAHHEVTVEFHQAQPAELAFVRADQIDLMVSVSALSFTPDLDRTFRQVHRVLRQGGQIVISVPHPMMLCADPDNPSLNVRSWADDQAVDGRWIHTADDLVTSLGRANFAIEILVEHHAGGALPVTLALRARRLGA